MLRVNFGANRINAARRINNELEKQAGNSLANPLWIHYRLTNKKENWINLEQVRELCE